MKTLYFDCFMGAAGDMLSAALFDLLPEKEKFIKKLNSIGLPGVVFNYKTEKKQGITGGSMTVTVNGTKEGEHHAHHTHEHHHNDIKSITQIIEKSFLKENVKKDILCVFGVIAEAEAQVHGTDIENIHFHEVGSLDAIADVAAVCLLIDEIAPEKIAASPVNVGGGTVKCAHGILPVPAPATALILKDVPVYSGKIKSELCTPTGAALLKYFVDAFGEIPQLKIKATGYGFGKKEFETVNCVRAILGESEDTDNITEFTFNVDDMTAEEISFACNILLENGAKDVFKTPVYMKKSRLGTQIHVLCKKEEMEKTLENIFLHTTTLGVRQKDGKRYILKRKTKEIATQYGGVKVKISSGYGVKKVKAEYEDIARIAKENGLTFKEAKETIYTYIKEKENENG